MAKGLAARLLKSRTQTLHQSQNSKGAQYGPEGDLLHGGLAGKSKAERNRIETERARRHNAEVANGSEKGKPWV